MTRQTPKPMHHGPPRGHYNNFAPGVHLFNDLYWWQTSLPLVFDKLCKSNRILKMKTLLSVLFRSLWRGCHDI